MSNIDSGPAQALMQIHQVEAQRRLGYDWQRQFEAAVPFRQTRWGRQLLSRMGNLLVAVGQRLEQMASAQPSYQTDHARESSQAARGLRTVQ